MTARNSDGRAAVKDPDSEASGSQGLQSYTYISPIVDSAAWWSP